MKKHITFILSCLFFICHRPFAQDAPDVLHSFNVPTPGTYAFSKVNNVDMSPFTGQIKPSIPLYVKELSNLNFQVALTYLGGGGLKREDPGSSVGKGWLLNCGGIIIRNKRGVPDDYKNTAPNTPTYVGTKYNGILYNDGVVNKSDGESRISPDDLVYNYDYGVSDSQHDIFEFNIQGRSGKFYIGKDKTIIVVPASGIKIIPQFGNQDSLSTKITSFTIVDESGIKYYFEDKEIAENKHRVRPDWLPYTYLLKKYVSAWLLTRIESPFSEDVVRYEYYRTPARGQSWSQYQSAKKESDKPYEPIVSNLELRPEGLDQLNIKSVVFSDSSRIRFGYFFLDASDSNPVLNKIEVFNHEDQLITAYELGYFWWNHKPEKRFSTAFYNDLPTRAWEEPRNWYLESISQYSQNGGSQPIYAFDYYLDGNLNDRGMPQYDMDYWGYHNGQANPHLIPFAIEGNAANRNPVLTYARLGALKSIHFQTGGYEKFEYELNDKKNANGSREVMGGLRLRRRTLHDPSSSSKDLIREYKYIEPDGTSSGFLGDVPEFVFTETTYYDDGGWPSNPKVKSTKTTYVSHPVNNLSSIEGASVGYRRVEEILKSSDGSSSGKIVHEYSDMSYIENGLWYPPDYYPYRPVDRPTWALGLPLKISHYSKEGKLVKQVVNQYHIIQEEVINENFRSLYVVRKGEVDVLNGGSGALRFIYKFNNYYPVIGKAELTSTNESVYQGIQSVVSKVNYSYDPTYHLPTSTTIENEKGEVIEKRTYYPFHYDLGSNSATTKMLERNILNIPIASETWLARTSGNVTTKYLTESAVTEFSILNGGLIRPLKRYYATMEVPILESAAGVFNPSTLILPNRNLEVKIYFTKYNTKGILTEQEVKGGHKSVIMRDRFNNVIMQAQHATWNQVAYTSFEEDDNMGNWNYSASGIRSGGITGNGSHTGAVSKSGLTVGGYVVTLWAKGSGNLTVNGVSKTVTGSWKPYKWIITGVSSINIQTNNNQIDEVRLYPKGAEMTTYSYKPLVGVSSVIDEKNQRVSYQYDEYNRLQMVYDHDNNLIKEYKYNYKPPYVSTAKSAQFESYNCPSGYVPGGPVTYTVPAGRYTSLISQADADAKAQDDANNSGQDYANEHGNCVQGYYNSVVSDYFTKNDCGANRKGSTVEYRIDAGTYVSTISQADADRQAMEALVAHGQAYANAVGQCFDQVEVIVTNTTADDLRVYFSGQGSIVIGSGDHSLIMYEDDLWLDIQPINSTQKTYIFEAGPDFYYEGESLALADSQIFDGMNITVSNF